MKTRFFSLNFRLSPADRKAWEEAKERLSQERGGVKVGNTDLLRHLLAHAGRAQK